jgi:hypothetical protein
VVFQLQALVHHIEALPSLPGAGVRSPQHRLALGTLSELQLADVAALTRVDETGHRSDFDARLDHLSQQLPALSDSLSLSYLSHATVSRHLHTDSRGERDSPAGVRPASAAGAPATGASDDPLDPGEA